MLTSLNIENDLEYYYLNYKKEEFIETYIGFPTVNKLTHTMSDSIDLFCVQKIPINYLLKYLRLNYTIDIIGICPDIFKKYNNALGYFNLKEISFINNTSKKEYNYKRPLFFTGKTEKNEKKIIVSIPPGNDYIKHYLAIIIHSLSLFDIDYAQHINIYRFPLHEKYLTYWTELNENFIKKNDIVILGNVSIIERKLPNNFKLLTSFQNDFYGSKRYIMPNGTIINLLGVKFSYWGNLSRKIVARIIELGSVEIIYSAKLGSLIDEDSLYNYIFTPDRYINFDYINQKSELIYLKNYIAESFTELKTSIHCSVPTILEQNYYLRKQLSTSSLLSIDNEISQIAEEVYKYNKLSHSNVKFSAIHFATDYLRRFEEKNLKTTLDLSNNRCKLAKSKKIEITKKINNYLYDYLNKIDISKGEII